MADAAAVEGEEFAQEEVQKEPTEEAPPPVNVPPGSWTPNGSRTFYMYGRPIFGTLCNLHKGI